MSKFKKTILISCISVAVVIAVALGVMFYISKNIEQKLSDMIQQNKICKVTNWDFSEKFGKSNGSFECNIQKDQLGQFITNFLINNLGSIVKPEERQKILDLSKLAQEDLDVRVEYQISHSLFSIANGFKSTGTLKILTPFYKNLLQESFGATNDDLLNFDFTKSLDSSDCLVKFTDMQTNKILLSGLNFKFNTNSQDEFKSVGFGIDKIKADGVELENLGLNLNLKDGIKDLNLETISTKYKTHNLKLDKFKVSSGMVSFVDISGVSTSGVNQEVEDKIVLSDKQQIAQISIFDVIFKNISWQTQTVFEKSFFDNYFAKYAKITNNINNPQELEKVLSEYLGNGIKINIKDFGFENKNSDKLNANLNLDIASFKNFQNLAKNTKFEGSVKISTSVDKFLSSYIGLDMIIQNLSEWLSEYFKKDGDGVKMEFYFDQDKSEIVINNLKRIKIDPNAKQPQPQEDDKFKAVIEHSANALAQTLQSINTYYIANGGFGDNFIQMTGISDLETISDNEAILFVADKKCLKISFEEHTIDEKTAGFIKVEKFEDQEDEICGKFYQNEVFNEYFNTNLKNQNNAQIILRSK